MSKVNIHCKRCNKVIARLTPKDAAHGKGVITLCMTCCMTRIKPKPYRTWVDIREQQGARPSKTIQEQMLSLTQRGKHLRGIVKNSKRHSKFKYKL